MTGRPAPLLVQSGWTDALFPVPQALGGYDALLRRDPRARIALQVGDLGHGPAANHPADTGLRPRGRTFFDAWLRGRGAKPRTGVGTAYTMTCPASAPAGGGPYRATRFGRLARGRLALAGRRALRVDATGASAPLAAALSPLARARCARRRPRPD